MSINDEERISHQSFGTIQLSRVQGGDRRMFGSSLRHGSWIAIRVADATIQRSLGQDHVYPGKEFLELYITEVDFARFIASAGIGEGTPVTINRRVLDGQYTGMGEPPMHKATANTFKKEVKEDIAEAVAGTKEALIELNQLKEQPRVSKADLARLEAKLRKAVQNMESNAPFMMEQAERTIANMTVSAKAEIEAFLKNTATSMGVQHMQERPASLEGDVE